MAAARATLIQLMGPQQANIMGNVHGGNILRICEESGRIASGRWACSPVAMVAASETQFRAPMHVGEVATVCATLDYVSKHAMRVSIDVSAENLIKGTVRHTNKSSMWFAAVNADTMELLEKPLHPLHPCDVSEEASQQYERHRSQSSVLHSEEKDPEEFPVVLVQAPGVESLAHGPYVSAGFLLKAIDTAGALVAIAHARRPCVTVHLDDTQWHTPVRMGDLCTLRAAVTYTSERSIETHVQVWTEKIFDKDRNNCPSPVCAVEARLIFVALDADEKPEKVRQLPVEARGKRWAVAEEKHRARRAEALMSRD